MKHHQIQGENGPLLSPHACFNPLHAPVELSLSLWTLSYVPFVNVQATTFMSAGVSLSAKQVS